MSGRTPRGDSKQSNNRTPRGEPSANGRNTATSEMSAVRTGLLEPLASQVDADSNHVNSDSLGGMRRSSMTDGGPPTHVLSIDSVPRFSSRVPTPGGASSRPTPAPLESIGDSGDTISTKKMDSMDSAAAVSQLQSGGSQRSAGNNGNGIAARRGKRLVLQTLESLRSPRTPKELRSPASPSSRHSGSPFSSFRSPRSIESPGGSPGTGRVNFAFGPDGEFQLERSNTFFGENGNYDGSYPAGRHAIGDPEYGHCASNAPAYIGMASHDFTIGMAKVEQSVKNWQEQHTIKYREQMQATHFAIVEPEGRARVVWDIFAFALIAYQIFIIPVEYAFDETLALPFNGWWWVEIFNGVFFTCDLVLNCLTAYIKVDGIVIRSQRKILKRYFLKPPFYALLDAMSLTPFVLSLLELQTGSHKDDGAALTRVSKTGKFTRALRLLKLLRVMRALMFARRLTTRYIRGTRFVTAATRLINLCLCFILVAHFGACTWRMFAEFEVHAAEMDVNSSDLWQAYVLSAWWAISTLSGAEPPTSPVSISDMILWSMMSIISVGSVSLAVGCLVQIFDALNEETKEFNTKMQIAQRFLTEHQLPHALKAKVLAAVQTAHDEQQSRGNFQNLVEPLLSQDLLHQLHGTIYGDVIRRFPPFSDPEVPERFLHKLVFDAAKKYYSVNDIIIQEGKRGESMVFILEGACLLHSVTQKVALPRVTHGWWLGEKVIFWNEESAPIRTATCQAVLPCTTLEIDRQAFKEAVEDFKLEGWLDRMRAKGARGEPWGCPACGEDTHWFKDCRKACLQGDWQDEDGIDYDEIAQNLKELALTNKDGVAVMSFAEAAHINFRQRKYRFSEGATTQARSVQSLTSAMSKGGMSAASPGMHAVATYASRSLPLGGIPSGTFSPGSDYGASEADVLAMPHKIAEVLMAVQDMKAELSNFRHQASSDLSPKLNHQYSNRTVSDRADDNLQPPLNSALLKDVVDNVAAMRRELCELKQGQRAVERRMSRMEECMHDDDKNIRSLLEALPEAAPLSATSRPPASTVEIGAGYPVAQGVPYETSAASAPAKRCLFCSS